ncbi:DUF4381 domain-containing protein [Pseudoxanthomonas dokdonensis]
MAALVLRDVHVPSAPAWWPLAPGWWLLLAALVLLLAGWALMAWRRSRRRRRHRQLFDASQRGSPSEQVAAMSELLRRASRRADARADRLHGEAWLRFLDGDHGQSFSQGPGRLLLDGGFQPTVEADAVERLRMLARPRFLALMEKRR